MASTMSLDAADSHEPARDLARPPYGTAVAAIGASLPVDPHVVRSQFACGAGDVFAVAAGRSADALGRHRLDIARLHHLLCLRIFFAGGDDNDGSRAKGATRQRCWGVCFSRQKI